MSPMGGHHRRDQSDSNVPLRQSDDFHDAPVDDDGEGLRVRIVPTTNGSATVAVHLGGVDTNNSTHLTHSTDNNVIVAAIIPDCLCSRMDLLKTLVAFACLVVSTFLNFFLLTVIHDVVPRTPLPDLVFMIIPQQKWAWQVSDVLSTVSSVIGFACVFLHKQRIVVLRRVLLLGAILYGLRAICLGVTFMPPAFERRDEICQPQVNRTAMYAMEVATRFVTYVVTLGLTSGQDKILCGDLMFSGHTIVFSIMYFVQLQYTPRRLAPLRLIMMPVTFIGIAALVVSGGHYTIDVLIAYWLTSHIFWSYHQVFELSRQDRLNAPLSRVWWFWVCYWFESDVPEGRLKNEWTWPLSRPHWLRRYIQSY